MSPAARLLLTILAAVLAAALTVAVAAWARPSVPVIGLVLPVALLVAAALILWRRR